MCFPSFDCFRTHFVPVASQRERTSKGDDFPGTFSGLGHAPSEGKGREFILIFCNGTRADSVGVESTGHPHFPPVFAGFQVGGL